MSKMAGILWAKRAVWLISPSGRKRPRLLRFHPLLRQRCYLRAVRFRAFAPGGGDLGPRSSCSWRGPWSDLAFGTGLSLAELKVGPSSSARRPIGVVYIASLNDDPLLALATAKTSN